MTELGSGSGVKIVQDGQRLRIVNTRTASLATLAFVLSLLTLLPGAGGAVAMVQGTWTLGLILVAIGGLAAAGLAVTIAAIRRRRRTPLGELVPVAIIDLEARVLCDGAGRVLAPLEQVRFQRTFQIGSSSPGLAAVFSGQRLMLARGNPFAGGLGSLEAALRQRGLAR